MKIIDEFLQWLGLSGDEDERELEKKESENAKTSSSTEGKETPIDEQTTAKVLNFSSAASGKENSPSYPLKLVKLEIKTIKPKNFDEAPTVSNYLRDRVAVVVNFEGTDTKEATRILDFISGTVYAIGGKIKSVGEKVFICAPDSVTIEAYEDEKKSKGISLD